MRPRPAALLPLLLAGCSYAWTEDDSLLPGIGTPADPRALVKLNATPSGPATVLHGADGTPWAAFCEYRDGNTRSGSFRACKRVHLSRLAGARADETWLADTFVVRDRALFAVVDDDRNRVRSITVHRPGDPPGLDATFTTLPGPGLLYTNDGGDNDVFAYWVLDASTTTWNVWRRDKRFQLTLRVPDGADPADPGSTMDFLFTRDGSRLVLSAPDHQITVHSTLDGTVRTLGSYPGAIFLDEARGSLLVAGPAFWSVPLDGAPRRVLSSLAFDPATLSADAAGNAWFRTGGALFRVPLDGSAAAERVVDRAARLLGVGPGGQPVYSLDAATRYVNGAGDGWVGGWRFLERGFYAGFSLDGQRIYALDQAATTNAVGSLYSLPATGSGEATLLGRNVGRLDGLADGRLVAVENQATVGSWNRLVIIDEPARARTFVLDGAADFEVVRPGEAEAVADVVSGASGYDIYRVPLPARAP